MHQIRDRDNSFVRDTAHYEMSFFVIDFNQRGVDHLRKELLVVKYRSMRLLDPCCCGSRRLVCSQQLRLPPIKLTCQESGRLKRKNALISPPWMRRATAHTRGRMDGSRQRPSPTGIGKAPGSRLVTTAKAGSTCSWVPNTIRPQGDGGIRVSANKSSLPANGGHFTWKRFPQSPRPPKVIPRFPFIYQLGYATGIS